MSGAPTFDTGKKNRNGANLYLRLALRAGGVIIRSQEVHYRELIYIIVGNINFFKSMICTYTVHYFLPEREYREMIQNRRSKHKDINDMLDNTIQTI